MLDPIIQHQVERYRAEDESIIKNGPCGEALYTHHHYLVQGGETTENDIPPPLSYQIFFSTNAF